MALCDKRAQQDKEYKKYLLKCQIKGLEALVAALGGADDRRVTDQGVVDSGVWDQVGLELIQVDIQRAVESQRGGDRADNLSDQTVEVFERGAGNIKVATANIVDGLVVNKERAIGVLDGAVCGEDRVVGLNNGSGDQGGRVDGKLELRLFTIIGAQAFEEERTESGASSTTKGVEDEEALEAGAVVLEAPQLLAHLSSSQSIHIVEDGHYRSHRTRTRRILSKVPSRISFPMV
jgi:hypothetical protein